MEILIPNWPAPTTIRAFTTTRIGGHSQGPYAHLNLGLHAGDDPQAVNANRSYRNTITSLIHRPG